MAPKVDDVVGVAAPMAFKHRPSSTETVNGIVVAYALVPRAFTLVWCLLLGTRCLCALFLLAVSRAYAAFFTECMSYYANLLSPQVPVLYPPISWFCVVLSVAHWVQIAKTLYASARMRRLVFNHKSGSFRSRNQIAPTESRIPKPRSRWRNAYRSVFGRQGFFGAESSFFEFQFLVREIVEMASQTSQVIQGSNLIGKPWINHALVAILFVNSWSTPAVQYLTRSSPALERVLCLAVDVVLDIIMNVVLSVVLALPYLRAFDYASCSFDIDVLYSDVKSINLVMESRMVFVRGSTDLILKLMPHVSIYLCLNSIQALLEPEKTVRERQQKSFKVDQPRVVKKASRSISIVTRRIARMQSRRLRGHNATLVHVGFLLWGLIVLVIHLKTSSSSNLAQVGMPLGCVQPLRPWFSTKPACSVFRYSCLTDNATSPVEATLAVLEPSSLAALVLYDCAELQVPPMLKTFSGLLMLDIWRSNIVRWGPEAAITEETHPSLIFFCIEDSTLAEIPDGLLQNLPASLQDIEISHTNLSSLPDNLDTVWANIGTLYIEYCNFTEFPSVLQRMNVADLSLVGNDLTTLPALPDRYFSLAVSNNRRLASIANRTDVPKELSFLALENTAVTSLAGWVKAMAHRSDATIYAFGTPLCDEKTAIEIEENYGANATLTCVNTNPRADGRYPLALVERLRSEQMQ